MSVTTVKVSKKLVLELNKLKIHPRQSNEEIVWKLLKSKKTALNKKQPKFSDSKKTTIKVSKELVLELNKLKIHPRQSNEEIIWKLLISHNKND